MARWARWVFATVAATAVVVAVADYLQRTDVSKNYEQTWPQSYETTTCSEWNDEMTDEQQFAGAADLRWEQLKRNGGKDRPDYDEVMIFQSSISRECKSDATRILADVGATFGFD